MINRILNKIIGNKDMTNTVQVWEVTMVTGAVHQISAFTHCFDAGCAWFGDKKGNAIASYSNYHYVSVIKLGLEGSKESFVKVITA